MFCTKYTVFIFINFFLNFCGGCIRSPVVELGPTITTSTEAFTFITCSPNPCIGSFTTSGVTVIDLPVDNNSCIYSILVSCTDPTATLITINMNTNLQVNSPTTFIYNEMSSSYIFNTVMGSGAVNNLECECAPISCPTPPTTGPGVVLTTPTVDSMCIYTLTASCTNPVFSIIFNSDISTATENSQTLTCNNGIYEYGSPPTTVTNIECGCADNECPPISGSGVEVTPPALDGNCVYTVEASCTNPAFSLTFNFGNRRQSPQTLTCRDGTYQYDNPGVDIFDIECFCAPNPCENSLTVNTGAFVSDAISDDMCIYTVEASCINDGEVLIYNSDPGSPQNSPQTLTCENPPGLYSYGSLVNEVHCECPANICDNSYTTIGTDITVSNPTITFDCIYQIEVTCTDPVDFIVLNSATNNVQSNNPSFFDCDPLTMKYYNTRINQVNIDTLQCGCGDNPCPVFTTEPGVDLTTPTANAMCVYTLEASCANTAMYLVFNMDTSTTIQGPQTATCTNGAYQYSSSSGIITINNIRCECRQIQCFPLNTDASVVLTTPMPDNDCIYSLEASCTFPEQVIAFNSNGANTVSSPQTITCTMTGPGVFTYTAPAVTGSVSSIRCQCAQDYCPFSFIPTPDIVITELPPTDQCTRPIQVSCSNPGDEILVNAVSDDIRAPNPSTFNCDQTAAKYFYNTVAIDTIACSPACAPNSCGTIPAGNDVSVSTPIANGACVYSSVATCNTGTMLQVDLTDTRMFSVNSPHTFTCSTGPYWLFVNGADMGDLSAILGCT